MRKTRGSSIRETYLPFFACQGFPFAQEPDSQTASRQGHVQAVGTLQAMHNARGEIKIRVRDLWTNPMQGLCRHKAREERKRLAQRTCETNLMHGLLRQFTMHEAKKN